MLKYCKEIQSSISAITATTITVQPINQNNSPKHIIAWFGYVKFHETAMKFSRSLYQIFLRWNYGQTDRWVGGRPFPPVTQQGDN